MSLSTTIMLCLWTQFDRHSSIYSLCYYWTDEDNICVCFGSNTISDRTTFNYTVVSKSGSVTYLWDETLVELFFNGLLCFLIFVSLQFLCTTNDNLIVWSFVIVIISCNVVTCLLSSQEKPKHHLIQQIHHNYTWLLSSDKAF